MNPAVCITTLNHASSIKDLVRTFRDDGFPVFVVDDGSEDGTPTAAVAAGAKVVITLGRKGIGPCLLQAWRWAMVEGYDSVIQIDAGAAYNPDEMTRLLVHGLQGADVVIGSRFLPESLYFNWGKQRTRPYLSRLASFMMNTAHGSDYSDWTSGYRFLSIQALALLTNRSYIAKMQAWHIEVLAYASEAGLKIAEAPITFIAGRSSFNREIAREAFRVWSYVFQHVGWPGSKFHELRNQ